MRSGDAGVRVPEIVADEQQRLVRLARQAVLVVQPVVHVVVARVATERQFEDIEIDAHLAVPVVVTTRWTSRAVRDVRREDVSDLRLLRVEPGCEDLLAWLSHLIRHGNGAVFAGPSSGRIAGPWSLLDP